MLTQCPLWQMPGFSVHSFTSVRQPQKGEAQVQSNSLNH